MWGVWTGCEWRERPELLLFAQRLGQGPWVGEVAVDQGVDGCAELPVELHSVFGAFRDLHTLVAGRGLADTSHCEDSGESAIDGVAGVGDDHGPAIA